MIHTCIRHRPAASRLDVIVGVVIVLVALGIFISFIYQGRGRADQTKCAYHLKSMGEGVFGFQNLKVKGKPARAGHDFLPPARIDDTYATWPVLIAPYIVGDNPLLAWDQELPFSAQPQAVRDAVLPYFFCPARARAKFFGVYEPGEGPHLSGAFGDYACVSGDGDPAFPWEGPKANGAIIVGEVLERKGDRVLRWRGLTGLKDLPRGESQTMLIGEKHVPLGHFGDVAAGDGSIYDARYPASFARVGGTAHPLARSPAEPFNTNFGSGHAGMCLFLFADGSVKEFATSMNPEILGKLANRFE